MTTDDLANDIDYLRKLVKAAIHDVGYHERLLSQSHTTLKIAHELLKRADIDATSNNDADPDNEDFESVEEYAGSLITHWEWSIDWHQTRLKEAHQQLLFLATIVARGHYAEIDMDALRSEDASE